jgi:hypothetical protein
MQLNGPRRTTSQASREPVVQRCLHGVAGRRTLARIEICVERPALGALYEFTPEDAYAVMTEEPGGAARWTF